MSEIPQKPYYKLGEVCQYTDTQPYVLRFWESEFPQLTPQKSRTGQPVYTRRDIELILEIKHLLYTEEYTLAGAREQLGDGASSAATQAPRPRIAPPTEPEPDEDEDEDEDDGTYETAATEEPDLTRARQELQTLRRRVAELDERWRRAEKALHDAEQAGAAERERRERVAASLEGALAEIEALVKPSTAG